MAFTPYSPQNAAFTAEVHAIVASTLYHRIFSVPPERVVVEPTLLADSERGAVLDGELAIDCTVKVFSPDENLRDGLIFTIQERYRHPAYARFRDITITEWNTRSNKPSELYKIAADYFVYGYYSRPLPVEGIRDLVAALQHGVDREGLRRFSWIRNTADCTNLMRWGVANGYWRIGTQGRLVRGRNVNELFKMADGHRGHMLDLIAVDTATLKHGICAGTLPYRWDKNPRTGQPFITVQFSDLADHNAVVFWMERDDLLRPVHVQGELVYAA